MCMWVCVFIRVCVCMLCASVEEVITLVCGYELTHVRVHSLSLTHTIYFSSHTHLTHSLSPTHIHTHTHTRTTKWAAKASSFVPLSLSLSLYLSCFLSLLFVSSRTCALLLSLFLPPLPPRTQKHTDTTGSFFCTFYFDFPHMASILC